MTTFLELLFDKLGVSVVIGENVQLLGFFALLTYALLAINWIVTTDWESKFHWCSAAGCASGLFYLHYAHAVLLQQYENAFCTAWLVMLWYHWSTWQHNYRRIQTELAKNNVAASLRRFQGSVFRFLIAMPTTKNASNQWNAPPFKNVVHALLIGGYSFLLLLHVAPFVTPLHCRLDAAAADDDSIDAISSLCCRYNYVMAGFESQAVQANFCSGRVRVAFAGSWSTGKTYLINALLGHAYSTAQSAPAPTTDKFVCLALGAPYNDPVRSDDYAQRRHCQVMSHINDVTQTVCGAALPNVLDVADTNTEFADFVFVDMPGWQREYGQDCTYRMFYKQLLDKVDFTYVVWDVSHGKIEEEFADFFRNKARGTNYELIYNRYESDGTTDMAFLNQQYAKMSHGQEILSQMYTLRLHENCTRYADEFAADVQHLRAKIKSVNQTVHDNRKKLMKQNILAHRSKLTGLLSLRKLKIGNRLMEHDLNLHVPPPSKQRTWRVLGIEL